MKKLICMVLLFMVLFTITACSNSKEGQNPDRESESSRVLSEQSEVESEEVKEREAETGTVQKK